MGVEVWIHQHVVDGGFVAFLHAVEYILVRELPFFSVFVEPVVMFFVAAVDNNFLQLLLIHLVFLVGLEVLVLFVLPVLHQFFEIVALVVFFAQLPRLEHRVLFAAKDDIVELFVDDAPELGVRGQEHIRHLEDGGACLVVPQDLVFWRLPHLILPKALAAVQLQFGLKVLVFLLPDAGERTCIYLAFILGDVVEQGATR